jgi:hypothetical protein
MSNIDVFNTGAALAFAKLYEAFPNEIKLEVADLDPDADRETILTYGYGIEWLIAEGFMKGKSVWAEPVTFIEAILTSKGFAALNSIPDAIKERQTLGKRITSALKSGSKETAKELISVIVKEFVSYGTTRLNP